MQPHTGSTTAVRATGKATEYHAIEHNMRVLRMRRNWYTDHNDMQSSLHTQQSVQRRTQRQRDESSNYVLMSVRLEEIRKNIIDEDQSKTVCQEGGASMRVNLNQNIRATGSCSPSSVRLQNDRSGMKAPIRTAKSPCPSSIYYPWLTPRGPQRRYPQYQQHWLRQCCCEQSSDYSREQGHRLMNRCHWSEHC